MALVTHIATLKTSIPFMNFFDGFRTSHELSKPAIIPYEAMHQMVRPQFLVPMHGEHRHLREHVKLGRATGLTGATGVTGATGKKGKGDDTAAKKARVEPKDATIMVHIAEAQVIQWFMMDS